MAQISTRTKELIRQSKGSCSLFPPLTVSFQRYPPLFRILFSSSVGCLLITNEFFYFILLYLLFLDLAILGITSYYNGFRSWSPLTPSNIVTSLFLGPLSVSVSLFWGWWYCKDAKRDRKWIKHPWIQGKDVSVTHKLLQEQETSVMAHWKVGSQPSQPRGRSSQASTAPLLGGELSSSQGGSLCLLTRVRCVKLRENGFCPWFLTILETAQE